MLLIKKKTINYVSINSKKISKNSIFFGIKGKKFDGNKFANEAIKNGAVLAVSNCKFKKSKAIFFQKPLSFFKRFRIILINIYGEINRVTRLNKFNKAGKILLFLKSLITNQNSIITKTISPM